jgi:hypothetical protein
MVFAAFVEPLRFLVGAPISPALLINCRIAEVAAIVVISLTIATLTTGGRLSQLPSTDIILIAEFGPLPASPPLATT